MTNPCSDASPIPLHHSLRPQLPPGSLQANAAAEARPLYVSGDCEIDPSRRELRIEGSAVPIGGRAFGIIEILAESAGELVTKDELTNRIWQGATVLDNTLQVHVAALRKALGKHRGLLKTESQRGYRLLGIWTIRHHRPVAPPFSYQPIPVIREESSATNLPAIPGRLVGRAAVLHRLTDLMSAYRVVTLTGPGGIGKTALAVKIGHRLRVDFPDGTWLVELASLSDPALVPSAVARAAGLKLGGERISAETVARAIGDRKILLILDNCEHVIEAAASLAELLVRLCPRTTILATSRELLQINGEYICRVPPLDVPAPGKQDPDELLGHAAVGLFVSRAQSFDADFTGRNPDLQAIAAICRHLDGIPLAIEFAAATAAALGVRQVADGLRDRFTLLTRGRRTAVARHRTLRATLDWSYELLPGQEQFVLRWLAVFPAGFTLDAAAAVMRESGLDRSAVADAIASLVAKSLVTLDESEQSSRWRLLETIRAYGLEKLARHGETTRAARHHAAYFRDVFALTSGFLSRQSSEDLARHGREIDNVRAALDWCFAADGDAAIGIDLTAAFAPVWMNLSLMVECCDRCEAALCHIAPGTSSRALQPMWLRIALGSSLIATLGPSERSLQVLIEALETADALNDPGAQARSLSVLATAYTYRGEYAEAQNAVERLRQAATRIGDPALVVVADRLLGVTLVTAGRLRDGQQSLERVLHAPDTPHDMRRSTWRHSEHRAMARAMLARALWLQGFTDQAVSQAQASLEDLRSTDHPLSLCRALYYGICRIAPMTGDFVTAERAISRLIETATALNAHFWVTTGHLLQGKLAVERGEFANGLAILRAAFDTCRRSGWRISHQEFQAALAIALAGTGHAPEALGTLDAAIADAGAHESSRLWYVPEVLRIKGEIALPPAPDGSFQVAETCFLQAAEMAAGQGALFWELRIALSLARLRVMQGRGPEARQLLEPIYGRFTEGFDTADLHAARAMLETHPLP